MTNLDSILKNRDITLSTNVCLVKTMVFPVAPVHGVARVGHDLDFPGGSDSKASAYSAGDPGSIPGSGRSAGEGNGNPLQ